MNYYNAVLLPSDNLARELVAYAQSSFSNIADGYCLSDKVYPHITLCQFETNKKPCINVAEQIIHPVYILEPDIRKGTDTHNGYYWLSLIIEKEDWLVQLQSDIRSQLEKEDCLVKAPTGELYNPHVTFCRTREYVEFDKDVVGFINETNGWRFEIGKSDRNGQYLR